MTAHQARNYSVTVHALTLRINAASLSFWVLEAELAKSCIVKLIVALGIASIEG